MVITHGLRDWHFGFWPQLAETGFPSELKDAEVEPRFLYDYLMVVLSWKTLSSLIYFFRAATLSN